VLIFEDLHWIDLETQAFWMAWWKPQLQPDLFADLSAEYEHAWVARATTLDPPGCLPADGATQLLDALLGDDHVAFAEAAPDKARVPLSEETVRTLIETKVLDGPPGRYRLMRPVETIDVPATVQIILAARIDRLTIEDKRLLQVAAVIGRQVPVSLLRPVAELSDELLEAGLHRLQAAEFVYQTGVFPDLEYSFKHALTQDVAYGGLLQDRRRELHARIIEDNRDHPSQPVRGACRTACPPAHPETSRKAVSYLLQAETKPVAVPLPVAEEWYRQARSAGTPASSGKWEQAYNVLQGMSSVLVNLGETRNSLLRLREAEVYADKLNDDRRRARVLARLTSHCAMHGEQDEAVTAGTRALAIADRLGDPELAIVAQTYLLQAYYYRADYKQAVELANPNLGNSEPQSFYYAASIPGPVFLRCWLLRSMAELGQFADAAPHAQDIIKLAEPTHSPYPIGQAHLSAGWCLLAKGDWSQARAYIERGTLEYRKGDIRLALPHGVASSARLLAQFGEAGEAMSCLQEGEELLARGIANGTIDQAGMDYGWLGRAAMLLGRLEDAQRLAKLALQNSPVHPGFAAHALHLLGDLATHPDQFNAAQGEYRYRKALTLAEARGMRPLVAHCHFGLGTLFQRTGKREQASEHLATATAAERWTRFWLEQAGVDAPANLGKTSARKTSTNEVQMVAATSAYGAQSRRHLGTEMCPLSGGKRT
jgi:tetratricopeptide (TPR) repeat protein